MKLRLRHGLIDLVAPDCETLILDEDDEVRSRAETILKVSLLCFFGDPHDFQRTLFPVKLARLASWTDFHQCQCIPPKNRVFHLGSMKIASFETCPDKLRKLCAKVTRNQSEDY